MRRQCVCESVLLLQNVVRGDGICPTAHLRVILPSPIDQNMPPPPFHDISKLIANIDLSLSRSTSSLFPLPDNTATYVKLLNTYTIWFCFVALFSSYRGHENLILFLNILLKWSFTTWYFQWSLNKEYLHGNHNGKNRLK